jgi:DNA polymerase I-like protein with 3'-5' exonuclease and polymerase domains
MLDCHDEIVVECDAGKAVNARIWLEKAMIEGMETVLNGTDQVDVSVGVEARIARLWGEGS